MILDFWKNMNMRERLMVTGGAVLLVLTLFFLLIIDPFMDSLSRNRKVVPALKVDLAWMQEAASQVKELTAAGVTKPGSTVSPLSAIDRAARQLKIAESIKRVEPDEEKKVRVSLDDVIFDDMIKWIRLLNVNYDIRVVSISAERQKRPGRVSARVTFES